MQIPKDSKIFYNDEHLCIYFSDYPEVSVRYPIPEDSKQIKQEKLKKPFINKFKIDVVISYENKGILKIYPFSIPENYTWDGASIPRFCHRLIGSNTDPHFLIASMVHDVLCENKDYVDRNRFLSTLVLERLCYVSGVNAFNRYLIKHSVEIYQKIQGGW